MHKNFFPSVWLKDFYSKEDYDNSVPELAGVFSILDWIDERILQSRHPFFYKSWCVACHAVTNMRVTWAHGGITPEGIIHPAWTETAVCETCHLNSRMRAVIDFLKNRTNSEKAHCRVYIAEQTTPSFYKLQEMFPSLIGSEYLGPDYKCGEVVLQWRHLNQIRHEDLTEPSFADGEFDLVITQDVFEHVPDYRKAFSALKRVLKIGGQLIFTVPFFPDLETTRIRATIKNGEIMHHLPIEVHGNPVSTKGSLCFQNFGWDILHDLRGVGFTEAKASMYWGPWQGHIGYPFFVFSANVPYD